MVIPGHPWTWNSSIPSYAFDVIERHGSHFVANRRVFAMADEGE